MRAPPDSLRAPHLCLLPLSRHSRVCVLTVGCMSDRRGVRGRRGSSADPRRQGTSTCVCVCFLLDGERCSCGTPYTGGTVPANQGLLGSAPD